MSKITFNTELKGFGNNTGIEVSPSILDELGGGKRPPVKVTVNNYTYQSSVGSMSGMYLISFPKANREATGLAAGDSITVTLELESKDRAVVIPKELERALQDAGLLNAFQNLAYSKRKEFARQINEAKADDTRRRRIDKIIDSFK